jgi:MFS family permease
VVIGFNGISYLAVIGALQLMRVQDLTPIAPAPRGKGMIRDGVRYVRGRPDLMLIMVAAFFAGTFGMNFQMTSALMATQVYDKGPGEYGVLGTTLAIGSLTGALLGARREGRPRQRLVVLAGLAFGSIEVVLGLMPTYLTFALLTPLLGLSLLTMLNAANTTVQLSTDPAMRGRVMSLYMMLVMGGTPLGAPVVGWVGATFGARWTLIGGGAMSVLGVLLAVALFRGVGSPWRTRRVTPTDAQDDAALAA